MRDKIVDDVIDKYYERSQVGITKYGTTLYTNNKDKQLYLLNHYNFICQCSLCI